MNLLDVISRQPNEIQDFHKFLQKHKWPEIVNTVPCPNCGFPKLRQKLSQPLFVVKMKNRVKRNLSGAHLFPKKLKCKKCGDYFDILSNSLLSNRKLQVKYGAGLALLHLMTIRPYLGKYDYTEFQAVAPHLGSNQFDLIKTISNTIYNRAKRTGFSGPNIEGRDLSVKVDLLKPEALLLFATCLKIGSKVLAKCYLSSKLKSHYTESYEFFDKLVHVEHKKLNFYISDFSLNLLFHACENMYRKNQVSQLTEDEQTNRLAYCFENVIDKVNDKLYWLMFFHLWEKSYSIYEPKLVPDKVAENNKKQAERRKAIKQNKNEFKQQ